MKKFVFLALFVLCSCGSAKNEADVTAGGRTFVKDLSVRTSIAAGWKFRYEDNMAFKEIGFDDSSWASVDFPKAGIPFKLKESSHVWFRKSFDVSYNLAGKSIAFYAGKLPDACEVFLNGSLIGSSGAMPPR